MAIDPRPSTLPKWYHEVCVLAVVALSNILNQAGAVQTLPSMNILTDAFDNVTSADRSWFMAAFPLTSGALILISGKFGDLYGLKKVMLCGTAWGALWTLLAGLSGYTNSVVFFCICRAMHGVGVAFVFPNAVGTMGALYTNGQRKANAFSFIGAMAPAGATLGVVFSALTAQFGHWQWAYYANCIVFVILGIMIWFFIPDIPRHAAPEVTMDWLGSAVGVAGLVLFNFASNQAPEAGWGSPYIIVLYIIGILLIVLFFFVELRAKYPLVPKEIMHIQTLLVLLPVGAGWGSFSIYMFYFWSLVMNLKGYTPLAGASTYVTFLVFGMLAAATCSFLIRRVRQAFILLAANFAFFIGITMLATSPVHQTYFSMLFAQMIIISFGMDLSFPASSLILSDALPKKHQGMASSLVSTMINYSMSISLGYAATADVKVFASTGDSLKAYRAAMYVGIGFSGVGVLLAFVLLVLSYIRTDRHKGVAVSADSTDQGDNMTEEKDADAFEQTSQHVSRDHTV